MTLLVTVEIMLEQLVFYEGCLFGVLIIV